MCWLTVQYNPICSTWLRAYPLHDYHLIWGSWSCHGQIVAHIGVPIGAENKYKMHVREEHGHMGYKLAYASVKDVANRLLNNLMNCQLKKREFCAEHDA